MRCGPSAALFSALILSACGASAAHVYPAEAQAEFHRECPADNPVCVCTWDAVTRALPYEEYETAMARFRSEGVMDTRITRASTKCREKHAG